MDANQALYQTLSNLAEICHQQGISRLVLSPGSRSAPLALTFLRHGGFESYHIVDERSAAYFALGLAKQDLVPIILICTSGTATLNYAPAVAEAYFQQIPLLVFTADRPPEWIGQNDNQAIYQIGIYGKHVLANYQMPVDYQHRNEQLLAERNMNDALFQATGNRFGPVHLNFPFREPFYPENKIPAPKAFQIIESETAIAQNSPNEMEHLINTINQAESIWLLAGMCNYKLSNTEIARFCSITGALCLADPLSNLHLANQVYHFDSWLENHPPKPDLVISFGGQYLSKKLKLYLRNNKPNHHFQIQNHAQLEDPFSSITQLIELNPIQFFHSIANKLHKKEMSLNNKTLLLDEFKIQNKLKEELLSDSKDEMSIAGKIINQLPNHCVLHFGNSTPVRYLLKWNFLLKEKNIVVYANRGTSGIDGSVSTAMGMAQKDNRQHILIIGDLSMYYDRNGLWHQYIPNNFKILVINNGGGGIFKNIEGPKNQAELEEYFVNQQPTNFEALAATHHLSYVLLDSLQDFGEQVTKHQCILFELKT